MSKSLDIPLFAVQKGEALHRQITRHIRTLIHGGGLPAGSKLPRMHDLAAHWQTNYFTVHTALTGLVREGLLERKPRLGTFVRAQSKRIRSVGIYYSDEILIKHEREFYRSLHAELLAVLEREKISARIFIDSRPHEERRELQPELNEAISSHAIQGVIFPLNYPELDHWGDKLPVPTSFFTSKRSEHSRICIDNIQFMDMACGALRDQGCRSVGLIVPMVANKLNWGRNENDTLQAAYFSALERFGLRNQKSWNRIPRVHQEQQEKYGYREFHKLWSQKERPEGLIVYPENVAHGVTVALLEIQVKVPSELKLVLHKNQNVDFLCPVPTNWIITREKDVAEALVQQIQDRFAGLEPRNYDVHHTLVKMDEADPMASLRVGMSAGRYL